MNGSTPSCYHPPRRRGRLAGVSAGEGERGRRRCAAAVLLGAAVVLSALFWLPPFARRRGVAREDRWGGGIENSMVSVISF
ncbi:hypothetical protein GUJ93_ZPchr0003g18449 [Zizania palustris]|uniref:Uncharacterized protein n=1 Tax=Zizania palustris TaxID=103762 RepID=A0A8J5SCP6_ZIZPA|nr:hypothetical protein GUJ93_ZPchr0003g18449 [Zizania palustris]